MIEFSFGSRVLSPPAGKNPVRYAVGTVTAVLNGFCYVQFHPSNRLSDAWYKAKDLTSAGNL